MVAKIKSSKPNLLFGKLGQIPKKKKKKEMQTAALNKKRESFMVW